MLLKICLISALVVALEASPFGGQEDLEVDYRVRIQAAASAPAASPQMDVWRAEERQVRRHDCCKLDRGSNSECSLNVEYSNCEKYEESYKCRISKSSSRCVFQEMTKKEKADQKKEKADQKKKKADQKKEKADQKFNPDKCCILSNGMHGMECMRNIMYRERNCSDYKCSLPENSNHMSMERYMCVPEKMTKKEKADQRKEIAEREWDKTCCISGYGPRLNERTDPDWMCGDRYRSSTPRSNIEEECMLRVCIKPEDGKCFSQLSSDYYKNY